MKFLFCEIDESIYMNKQKILCIFYIIFVIKFATAQKCDFEERFTNVDYFSKSQIDSLKNVTYGKALNFSNNLQDLKTFFLYSQKLIFLYCEQKSFWLSKK